MGSYTKREHIKFLIRRLSKRAAREGTEPNIDALAIKLSSKYSQSGISLDEICEEITAHLEEARNQILLSACDQDREASLPR